MQWRTAICFRGLFPIEFRVFVSRKKNPQNELRVFSRNTSGKNPANLIIAEKTPMSRPSHLATTENNKEIIQRQIFSQKKKPAKKKSWRVFLPKRYERSIAHLSYPVTAYHFAMKFSRKKLRFSGVIVATKPNQMDRPSKMGLASRETVQGESRSNASNLSFVQATCITTMMKLSG